MGHSRAASELALVGVTVLWAGTFLLIKRALPWCDPIAFVTLRFSIASIVAIAIWRSTLGQLRQPAVWKHGMILGLTYAIGFYLQTWGLQHTTIARSALFTGTFVVFVPVLQRLWWRRYPTAPEWWGALTGMIGIALLARPEAGSLNVGDWATLAGALAWSYYMGYMSYAGIETLGNIGTGALVIMQCSVTAALGVVTHLVAYAVSWPAEQFLGKFAIVWNADVVGALLYTSVLASVVTTYLQTRLQPGVSAVRVALIFALEPVIATLLGIIAHGERLRVMEALGALMIVGAAFFPILTRAEVQRDKG